MSYSHTVIGIFDSDFAAQDAVDALINNGFDRGEIDVRNRRDVNGHPVSKSELEHRQDQKHESGLTAFFKTIFGDKDDDADKHYRLVVEGGSVVTVYSKTGEEAMRAADILDDFGAIDVDERTSQYSPGNAGSVTPGDYPTGASGSTEKDYHNPILTKHESEYASTRNKDRQLDEDLRELPRVEERSGPGTGSQPTAGKRSRSRINEWKGESSARLREDRDSETKIGW